MIGSKKILCVITARAGSKGIKNKNYRNLMGEPLFMWSVLASLDSEYVDKTVVSSNCKEIEKICLDRMGHIDCCGWNIVNTSNLEFIKRPEEISGDFSKNEEALIHTLQNINDSYDIVINLQPTSPCRSNFLLDKCIEKYYEGGYDCLITANKDTPFIWQRKDGKWIYAVDKNDCCNRKMRQEFQDDEDENNSDMIFHDNGNIYIVDKKVLVETECRIGKNPCIFETKGLNSLQIDEEYDFELIENIAKSRGLDSLI